MNEQDLNNRQDINNAENSDLTQSVPEVGQPSSSSINTELESPLQYASNNLNQDSNVYAGFWIRFWAYIVDLIIITSISGLLIKPVFRFFDWPLSGSLFSLFNISSAVLFYLYFVLLTKWFGQTLGKMIFGLKVISLKSTEHLSWSSIVFREWIGRYISASFLIPYLVVAFLPKKQGLHDYFAETTVIHEQYRLKNPILSIQK